MIFAVAAALVAMRVYTQRAMQGKLKTIADSLGEAYAPGQTESSIDTRRISNITTSVTSSQDKDGNYITTTRTIINNETETRRGWERVY